MISIDQSISSVPIKPPDNVHFVHTKMKLTFPIFTTFSSEFSYSLIYSILKNLIYRSHFSCNMPQALHCELFSSFKTESQYNCPAHNLIPQKVQMEKPTCLLCYLLPLIPLGFDNVWTWIMGAVLPRSFIQQRVQRHTNNNTYNGGCILKLLLDIKCSQV